MNRTLQRSVLALAAAGTALLPGTSRAEDSPQLRGIGRDAVSPESNLLQTWTATCSMPSARRETRMVDGDRVIVTPGAWRAGWNLSAVVARLVPTADPPDSEP
jgi:hypothetical protein